MTRRKSWLLFGLGLLALVLLAMGLSSVTLQPGHPFAVGGPSPDPADAEPTPPWTPDLNGLGKVLLALLIWVLFPLSGVYFLLSSEFRRRVLRDLLRVVGTMVVLYFFIKSLARRRLFPEPAVESPESSSPPVPPEFVVSPGEWITHPPEWLVLAVSLLFLGGLSVGIVLLGRALRPASKGEPLSRSRLAEEAESALRDLQAGGDLRDVVRRCYCEMTRILREERGLRRPRAMTPREFERRLREAGVAERPVSRLTQLFESVRYGDRRPNAREEREAQECLREIAAACRRGSP